jgi:hypothetical protein
MGPDAAAGPNPASRPDLEAQNVSDGGVEVQCSIPPAPGRTIPPQSAPRPERPACTAPPPWRGPAPGPRPAMSLSLIATILLQLLIAAAIGLGLARPGPTRARSAAALLAVAAAFLAVGIWSVATQADAVRTLALTHAFPGLPDGITVEVVDFPIGVREAPAWQWPLVFAAFPLLWGAVLLALRDRDLAPFWPLVLWGWTLLATHFALEITAAPRVFVRPIPFERLLYPVALAASFLITLRHVRLFPSLFRLIVLVELCRLPLAILGTLATQEAWNIGLDVHDTTRFVNPLAQLEVEVEPGSREQLAWLIWVPHAILMPAFYVLSTGGIAFCTSMFLQYGDRAHERAERPAEAGGRA